MNLSFGPRQLPIAWTTLMGAVLFSMSTPSSSEPTKSVPGADPVTSVPAMQVVAEAPALLQSGIPAISSELRERLDQYLNTRPAGLADVLPDGSQILIATRFATTAQLHVVAQPMGVREQITFRKEPVGGGQFVPGAPHLILFGQDTGGGEAYQYFLLNRQTGRTRLLTDGSSRHTSLSVDPNPLHGGKLRLAFASNTRNGKDTDVYVLEGWDPTDEATTFAAARRLTENSGMWVPAGWSPDGNRLLLVNYRGNDDGDLHCFEPKTNTQIQLSARGGKGSINEVEFSPDGKSVLLVTDRYSNFKHLYQLPLDKTVTTETLVALTPDLPWDVEALAVNEARHRMANLAHTDVALATNEDGFSRISFLSLDGTAKRTPVELPVPGVISALSFPRKQPGLLFFAMDSSQSPNDVFSLDLAGQVQRWTRGEIGGLDSSTFVRPEIVRYPSTGGFTIPAVLFRPAPTQPTTKRPVLIIWHGGPEGQSRPNFSAFVQFLVQDMGMAVLLPNVRGSDGYGKDFLAADNGVLREESLKDIGATLDWIATQPDLDAQRIGVYGGSYGGYMTLATATFYPDRIRAAVNVVGISSIPTFLQNTQAYRRDLRRAEYGDERVPEVRKVQERISPLNFVDRITCALFVQQGKNDPRVPQSEAEQIVAAVRKRHQGDPDSCWYLLGTNEGHGFARKDNRDYALAATVLFLQKHLVE